MKFINLSFSKFALLFLSIFAISLTSCNKDEDETAVFAASFQTEISATNFLEVTFKNYSSADATSFAWEFGDGNTSEAKEPVHLYATADTYTVKLTVSNGSKSATYSKDITLTDPDVALTLLTGSESKKWRLVRTDVSMGIGPDAATGLTWWSLQNDGSRPCVYNQTWTFNRDGSFDFDDGGMMWGEGGVFPDALNETCFEATAANMVNVDGVDVSSWLSGSHNYTYNPTDGTLTLTGLGAWIGLIKLTPGGDVNVPQASVAYDVTITEETGYDLMVVSITGDGFYWQINYVSYEDWTTEPAVVSFMADFDFTIDGFDVTFENKSHDADSYMWEFGDGNTSVEENPTHTYTAEGAYDVVLTAKSGAETKTATKTVTISLNPTVAAAAPTEPEANVISIYSDAYTDISGVDINPAWGQATITQEVDIAGEKAIKMANLNYQGIDWNATPQDVSGKTKLHVDVYCSVVTDVNLSVIGAGENPVKLTTEAGVWKSFDIALSEYTVPDLTQVIQVKFDDAGTAASATIFVDNIYFY